MLKFLRKIRLQLLSDHQFSKYLLYALGEILLVMIGILLALQINNWNEVRKNKQIEKELLQQFQTDLSADVQALQKVIQSYKAVNKSCEVLVRHLKQRLPYHDSLAFHFANWIELEHYTFNNAAISNLNSRGIEIIENVQLRNKIVNLYNQTYSYTLQQGIYFREDHIHFSYKIYLDRIEPIKWVERSVPNDYAALLDDKIFMNHVQWIKNASGWNNNGFNDILKEINQLIGEIEMELKG